MTNEISAKKQLLHTLRLYYSERRSIEDIEDLLLAFIGDEDISEIARCVLGTAMNRHDDKVRHETQTALRSALGYSTDKPEGDR